ncbi:multidrug efflux pump acriflavin resistance protein AcrB/AcrD/AcrF [Neoasaia chiangmaiensis NBRC 101099]|uniref:Efflux transporter periplasmic adaptor subunit n=1 Tax=Neoasaia chiangmaiensis TaxID=320497 RepID=A0A1U9KQ18_9PROT|nr:efflux RND transporter periplasmic adaptor subunit [Neoasaia chiangmaiensis]AQS87924.1 efflux transporter periplasmic adaptor subunit [Neoasaia chiangmaiensis]GBR39077.1 multidrug efflux pump acriflavin resistance protein AcrB/AcrD/AcrF [Neoasaia chiangmaiensis NBRC 101099]GEN15573.1 RND transporter MFP subunit [Neoasaia chiangmaiensis]
MATSPKLIAVAGGCILALYVGFIVVEKTHAAATLAAETDTNAVPDVSLITPRQSPSKVALNLPGTIDAWYQAPIYPQVSGYVKMWYKDYGAHVKAGDVLAEINAPALDAQYAQAKADLASVMAKYNLASVTAERWRAMGRSQSVSGQSVSVSNANEQSAKAEVDAAQRNVDHFEALEKFKTIVAPFDGIVTARGVSVGDYVSSGGGNLNATGGASELFTVADTHRLRLFVSVPEVFAYVLQPDITAEVSVPQYPDRKFTAQFLTTARGFDPNTRTAITEFTMDNANQELWPGTFASVALKANNEHSHLYELPSSALVFQEKGMQVATLTSDSHVHYKHVVVGRMADSSTEIQGGITPEDRVIDNPPADLLEGDKVNVVQPERGYNQSGFGDSK